MHNVGSWLLMPYDLESVLSGKRGYQVIRKIYLGENGSYGSKIANEIGTTQQVVSEIISTLEKENILIKGKRTQAQYYKIDYNGLIALFTHLMKSKLKDSQAQKDLIAHIEKNSDLKLEEIHSRSQDSLESLYSDPEDEELTFLYFFVRYTELYLMKIESSTLQDMIINDLIRGLLIAEQPNEEYEEKEWYQYLSQLALENENFINQPELIVRDILSLYPLHFEES